jgi:hypothetical protein
MKKNTKEVKELDAELVNKLEQTCLEYGEDISNDCLWVIVGKIKEVGYTKSPLELTLISEVEYMKDFCTDCDKLPSCWGGDNQKPCLQYIQTRDAFHLLAQAQLAHTNQEAQRQGVNIQEE